MTGRKAPTMVGLGEILWDMLPDGRKLGGAPANFAFHARQLGAEAYPVSRIGDDDLGREIRERLGALGLSGEFIQTDPEAPTGTVSVDLDAEGLPRYTIIEGVAWDRIAWTPELEGLARRADVVCYGSLAQRSPQSRAAIVAFLEATRPETLRVFDINLRQSFYSAEIITRGLELARVAKMNDEEAPVVASLVGIGAKDERAICQALLEKFELDLVCLTRGARGSLLVGRGGAAETPGVSVKVADTVGAGDAFIAAAAWHWVNLRGEAGAGDLERIGRAANQLGAWVAGQPGATPALSEEIRMAVLEA